MATLEGLHPTLSNSSVLTSSSLSSQKVPSRPATSSSCSSASLSANATENKQISSLYNSFINKNDHLGLAMLARQYGVPPNLRYKVWPILLKYHPYVIDPFIDATVKNDADLELDLKRVNNDINKYFKIRTLSPSTINTPSGGSSPTDRTRSSPNEIQFSPVEEEIVRILKATISKFFKKWGAIVKYDSGFTWIALNLAEWFPPIPNSNYVLIGKNCVNKNNSLNKYLTQITDSAESQEFNLDDDSYSTISTDSCNPATSMTFAEVFERLVLVLLHSKNEDDEDGSDDHSEQRKTFNKEEIVFKSGKIEKRINFFIVALSKLQPELFKLLSDEEFLLSNNKTNNEWLTWWLKYCGAKILNKHDRGRLWDLILGFRLNLNHFEKQYNTTENSKQLKLFRKFYSNEAFYDNELFKIDEFWFLTSDDTTSLKWSQIDYQFQLVFIFISILHKNESKLLEIDQSEMIEFFSNLNFKEHNSNTGTSAVNSIGEMNIDFHKGNIQKAIIEAGDLWRNWLWHELHDEINEI